MGGGGASGQRPPSGVVPQPPGKLGGTTSNQTAACAGRRPLGVTAHERYPRPQGGNRKDVKQLRTSKVQACLGIVLPNGTDPQRTDFFLSDHMLGSCIFGWGCGSFLLPALDFTISEHFSADFGITKTGALRLRPNPGIPGEMGTICCCWTRADVIAPTTGARLGCGICTKAVALRESPWTS